jgi:regulator of replication initiation timing
MGVAIPAAMIALGLGSVVGAGVGYVAHMYLEEPKVVIPPPEVIQEKLSLEELEAVCATLTVDLKTKVTTANDKVRNLEAEIAAKEAELSKLKAQDEKDAARAKAASKKWKAMEAELEGLRGQLQVAEADREQLRTELRSTLASLDRQIKETEKFKEKAAAYKEQSTDNLWTAFNSQAKVEICDRGTRNRHEKCHEAVDGVMAGYRGRFKECVDGYQAVPVLRQLGKKETMPAFSERLPEDNKFTRSDWIIIFCDPSLPQSRDMDLEGVKPAGRDALEEDLPEAEDDL